MKIFNHYLIQNEFLYEYETSRNDRWGRPDYRQVTEIYRLSWLNYFIWMYKEKKLFTIGSKLYRGGERILYINLVDGPSEKEIYEKLSTMQRLQSQR